MRRMPRQKSLMKVIEDVVRREIAATMASLLSVAAPAKKRSKRKPAKNGRRKRRGPGRPPGSKNKTT